MNNQKPKLSEKQLRFCQEYIIDLNGTAAAKRAGYSERSAGSQAEQHLKKPEIQKYIHTLLKQREQRTEITADQTVQELALVGYHNIQDFIIEGNKIVDLSKIDRRKAAAVASIKTTVKDNGDVVTELKLHDKVSALEKLGRHQGIFEKDNAQANKIMVKEVGYGEEE